MILVSFAIRLCDHTHDVSQFLFECNVCANVGMVSVASRVGPWSISSRMEASRSLTPSAKLAKASILVLHKWLRILLAAQWTLFILQTQTQR